jgi:hypothetical protein
MRIGEIEVLPGAVRKLSPVKAQLETFGSECTLAAERPWTCS